MATTNTKDSNSSPEPIFDTVQGFEFWLLRGLFPEGDSDAWTRAIDQNARDVLDTARRLYLDAYAGQASPRWLSPVRQSLVAGQGTPLQVVAVHPNDAHSNAVGFALNYVLRCGFDPCPLPDNGNEGGASVLRLN